MVTLSITTRSVGVPERVPTASMVALSRPYYQYKNQAELNTWNNLFVPITQGS